MKVLIAGDVCPQNLGKQVLLSRMRLSSSDEVDLFLWTLDAAVEGPNSRYNWTHVTFESAALGSMTLGKRTIAITASNHLNDSGDEGVIQTLQSLGSFGISHTGSGGDLKEAQSAALVSTEAGTIALLAFAETESWVRSVPAEENVPGVRAYNEDDCCEAIAQAVRQADYVWVFLHWGQEFIGFPEPRQRRAAKKFCETGASLVIGSHTHIPMGRESFNGNTVFYGLGNFMFPALVTSEGFEYKWDWVSRRGLVVEGRFIEGRWIWNPGVVKLDRSGIPHFTGSATDSICPDYGKGPYCDLGVYDKIYPNLAASQRRRYYFRRLLTMSLQEKAHRLLRILDFRAPR